MRAATVGAVKRAAKLLAGTTIAAMATGSLNVLAKNPQGFCLMIEGGAIQVDQPGAAALVLTMAAFAGAAPRWIELAMEPGAGRNV